MDQILHTQNNTVLSQVKVTKKQIRCEKYVLYQIYTYKVTRYETKLVSDYPGKARVLMLCVFFGVCGPRPLHPIQETGHCTRLLREPLGYAGRMQWAAWQWYNKRLGMFRGVHIERRVIIQAFRHRLGSLLYAICVDFSIIMWGS